MEIIYPCLLALLGTGFTWLMTTLGAATVFVMKDLRSKRIQDLCLGFASGVMIAASVWSLLLPAIDQATMLGLQPWLPAAGGFALGGIFFYILDLLLPHSNKLQNSKGSTKLLTAITLHNIPEGMAVGLAFALAVQGEANESALAAAIALAIGVGVQNFPEGAAISLPMFQKGAPVLKSFWKGSLSGIVEPIGGVFTVLLAGAVQGLMPWLLSFAAGAMIYVVADELIPDAHKNRNSNIGTTGTMVGFLLMMILDVALSG